MAAGCKQLLWQQSLKYVTTLDVKTLESYFENANNIEKWQAFPIPMTLSCWFQEQEHRTSHHAVAIVTLPAKACWRT